MKPIVFITEVREFIDAFKTRHDRRSMASLVTRQCQKNASRSHQLLVLTAVINEMKEQGKRVPCVPSLDGSTSESSGSAPNSTSDDATSETGSCVSASTSILPEACDAN